METKEITKILNNVVKYHTIQTLAISPSLDSGDVYQELYIAAFIAKRKYFKEDIQDASLRTYVSKCVKKIRNNLLRDNRTYRKYVKTIDFNILDDCDSPNTPFIVDDSVKIEAKMNLDILEKRMSEYKGCKYPQWLVRIASKMIKLLRKGYTQRECVTILKYSKKAINQAFRECIIPMGRELLTK